MSTETKYATITVTEAQLRAALDEYEREPIPCPRCDCGLIIREVRTGLIEALCSCCAARWMLDVVR